MKKVPWRNAMDLILSMTLSVDSRHVSRLHSPAFFYSYSPVPHVALYNSTSSLTLTHTAISEPIMTDTYTQSDSRIQPLPLSTYKFLPLPTPPNSDAIVKLSLVPTTSMTAPRKAFTPAAAPDEKIDTPSWSFLVEKGDWAGLFDLGLRVDIENEPK